MACGKLLASSPVLESFGCDSALEVVDVTFGNKSGGTLSDTFSKSRYGECDNVVVLHSFQQLMNYHEIFPSESYILS